MNEIHLQPGQKISHPDFGEGIVVETIRDGYLRAFFTAGEKQVAESSVTLLISRNDRLTSNVVASSDRLKKIYLTTEAFTLPLLDNAAALTAAKVDLLPHQVVLTHRIATTSPRRFMIADEVGLGKTIETALILRELASRGELNRALMIVPAGLVNNWHHELNEVFHLNFEVFGSEGDVTDRKSNAFAKHDRLIASIDTLKRPERIQRLLEAPAWDLVVFDEAHHLTASKNGNKIRKTENFKLAEALKTHSRDLLILSATPHQGDHFRFWMLAQLLNPTLFRNTEDMIENRHRLNSIIFRRTKADACKPDGSPLFARRWVHTESFLMSDEERTFYEQLKEYLEDGFMLAKDQGNQGRALGFVMAIFQKIAASSFAAVKKTLNRRLLNLTLHEATLRDKNLDVEGKHRLLSEARELIGLEYDLGKDPVSQSEIDRILADLKYKIVSKMDEASLAYAADTYNSEETTSNAEDLAASAVSLILPEERNRIRELLKFFPQHQETKVEKLVKALGSLWQQNPNEKIVIFATYLGTVDLISREIENAYPGQGVVTLRGGDHAAKLSAEKRFRLKDGPRVMVCTAAGREGINLQFARILFNFDLPWNPMDMEQRIGRIHRYGQNHTAQVYNLVLSDTIEGRIFLMLNDKLTEIAKTLGKVDEQGNIAEDFRSQILGQLSEKLSYEKLYQEALSDPELKRTRLEVEAALSNATEARKVVFELFQDLDSFSLEDYKPLSDIETSVRRLFEFVSAALTDENKKIVSLEGNRYEIRNNDGAPLYKMTMDRDLAVGEENLDLLGLDHPLVQTLLKKWQSTLPEELAVSVKYETNEPVVMTWWLIQTHGKNGQVKNLVRIFATDLSGKRQPNLEQQAKQILHSPISPPVMTAESRKRLLTDVIEPMMSRDLKQKDLIVGEGSFTTTLLGWVEISK